MKVKFKSRDTVHALAFQDLVKGYALLNNHFVNGVSHSELSGYIDGLAVREAQPIELCYTLYFDAPYQKVITISVRDFECFFEVLGYYEKDELNHE